MATVPASQVLIPSLSQSKEKRERVGLWTNIPTLQKKGNVGNIQQKPLVRSEKEQRIRQCTTGILLGTKNIKTLYRTGSLIMFTQQSLHHKLHITATQTTRWHNKRVHKNTRFLFVVGMKGENISMWEHFLLKRSTK
jgi:hypothetical protein